MESYEKLIIFTHHKCASTWLTSIVKDICEKNELNYIAIPWGRRCWLTGYTIEEALNSRNEIIIAINAEYESINHHILTGMVCVHVVRNPLSIVVSAYYSHLRTHPIESWDSLADQRHVLMSVDKDVGMAITFAFLESRRFQPETNGPLYDISAWNYDDPRIVTLRMEDITSNISGFFNLLSQTELLRNAVMPDPVSFLFSSITGRRQGEIDLSSHYRCGSGSEWREALPTGIILYLSRHYNDFLLKFYPEVLLERPAG